MSETHHELLSATGVQPPAPPVSGPQTVGRLSFRRQVDRWLLGLTRSSVQGGAIAVKAFFGAAGASTIPKLGIPAITPLQAGAIFLFGAGWHFFDYLANTPIPDVPSPEPNETKVN